MDDYPQKKIRITGAMDTYLQKSSGLVSNKYLPL